MGTVGEVLRSPLASEALRFGRKHVAPVLAGGLALGTACALTEIEAVVVHAHGTISHQATDEAEWLAATNDWVMWTLGATAETWSAAHVGDVKVDEKDGGIMHNGTPDASIKNA